MIHWLARVEPNVVFYIDLAQHDLDSGRWYRRRPSYQEAAVVGLVPAELYTYVQQEA